MSKVPPNLLIHLKCSVCENHLHTAPIVSRNNSRICGKCYRVLPEKELYHHELLYETVAEHFTFPCRYHVHGCPLELPFNAAEKHETHCAYGAIPSGDKVLKEKVNRDVAERNANKITCVSRNHEVEVETTFTIQGNKATLLQFRSTISMQRLEQLIPDSRIVLDGAVGLQTPPTYHTKVALESTKEETKDDSSRKCSHCFRLIRNQMYLCAFGHYTCRFCRGKACPQCETHVNATPIYPCSNYRKGCDVCLDMSDMRKHLLECEFNEFHCPLACGCSVETLVDLPEHLRSRHQDVVVVGNAVVKQFSRDDELWLMVAYGRVFKCQMLVFGDFVEFILVLVGPESRAEEFKYDVHVKGGDSGGNGGNVVLVRSALCLKWNQSVLDVGIRILSDELKKYKVTCAKFDYTLVISKTAT